MKLNDKGKTTINVCNVCWCRNQEEQMAGHGGMIIRFTGGGSTEVFEYEDPEQLDRDIIRIHRVIERLESPMLVQTPKGGEPPKIEVPPDTGPK